MMNSVRVFAPASVVNLGPGFDVLGLALQGVGDTVKARKTEEAGVRITEINGNDEIPLEADKNTVGIAAMEVLKKIGAAGGIEFSVQKGIPLGSGMGGSGSSAVAGGYAANVLYGNKLSREELLLPCTMGEAAVSGFHCDNVGASLYGGIIMLRSTKPPEVISLGNMNFMVVVAHPDYVLLTKKARGILPKQVPLESFVHNMARA
jgi:homoserine kinase